jgi:hypothetical protein
VTDKFGIQVAKRCVQLAEFDLRNCPNITAITVVAFCEHLVAIGGGEENRRPIPLTIDLRGTSFDCQEVLFLKESYFGRMNMDQKKRDS